MNLTFVGPVYEPSGYANLNRQLLMRLYKLGVNIRLKSLRMGDTPLPLDYDIRAVLREMERNSTFTGGPVLFSGVADIFSPSQEFTRNFGLTMLETDRVPKWWVDRCNKMDRVFVPTKFNLDTFTNSGVEAHILNLLPLGVDTGIFKASGPKLELGLADKFVFLANFEWVERKAPEVLLRAYWEAFSAADPVVLLLKTYSNRRDFGAESQALRSTLERWKFVRGGNLPEVKLYQDLLDTEKMAMLYRSVNCLVSASRGEGWNFPAIEAMSCKIPVIATGWSGHLEYLNEKNSYLVTGFHKKLPMGTDESGYQEGYWSQPDSGQLAELMRRVYNRPNEVKAKVEEGFNVVSQFDWAETAASLYQEISESQKEHRVITKRSSPANPKVAMVIPSWGRGCGVAQYTRELVESASEAGFGIDVFSKELELLPQQVKQQGYNVVHFQLEYSLYNVEQLEQVMERLFRQKCYQVATMHTFLNRASHYHTVLNKYADKILVHSERMAKVVQESDVDASKVIVVPMGSNVANNPRREPIATTGKTEPLRIGFFGQMYPHKGIVPLVLAAAELSKRYHIRLCISSWVVPNPISRQFFSNLKNFLSRMDLWSLAEMETTHQPMSEVLRMLSQMELNVLPYLEYEGIGISAAAKQMLAVDRPLIISDSVFFSDLPGLFKVKHPTPANLSAAIEEIISDQELQRKLVRNQKQQLKRLAWENVIEQHIGIYK